MCLTFFIFFLLSLSWKSSWLRRFDKIRHKFEVSVFLYFSWVFDSNYIVLNPTLLQFFNKRVDNINSNNCENKSTRTNNSCYLFHKIFCTSLNCGVLGKIKKKKHPRVTNRRTDWLKNKNKINKLCLWNRISVYPCCFYACSVYARR